MKDSGIEPVFGALVSALEAAHIPFVFIGALAAIEWSRPRATTDIDIVLSVAGQAWNVVDSALRSAALTPGKGVGPIEAAEELPDIAIYWSRGSPAVRVDVFIAKTDFEQAVLDSAVEAKIAGRTVRIASAEALIVYKLLASRPKDLLDVEAVFEARHRFAATLDWPFLDRWATEWGIVDRLEPWRLRFGTR